MRYKNYTARISDKQDKIFVGRVVSIALLLLLVSGCSTIKTTIASLLEPSPLRVGIAVDTPPLAYKKGGNIVGLETKFAAGLAASLGQRLEIVEMPRSALANALTDKQVDIVMAGMTVSEAQQHKLTSTLPYLISGQIALVRLNDFKRLGKESKGITNLTEEKLSLGVVRGSVGDTLIQGIKAKGRIRQFASAPEAVQALSAGSIDAFVFDLPANLYYAALYIDKGLTPGVLPLTKEELAWAVRPGNVTMRTAANRYLAEIEQSGELTKMLEQQIPFYNTAYSPKGLVEK